MLKKFLLFCACSSSIVFTVYVLPAVAAQSFTTVVVRVSDGDTIHVRSNTGSGLEKIRLYGIDAPEMEQAGGKAAQKFLESLIYQQTVTIEPMDTDQYGRMVAIVHLPNNNLTAQYYLLAEGHAWVYEAHCKTAICNGWRATMVQARIDKIGLWAKKDAVAPWRWRQTMRNGGTPEQAAAASKNDDIKYAASIAFAAAGVLFVFLRKKMRKKGRKQR